MSKYRALPAPEKLAQMAQTRTHAQIAAELSAQTGLNITRSAVSSALSRAGLATAKPRYSELIPWAVAPEHDDAYPLRMLRALGRSKAGLGLSKRDAARLASWLDERAKTQTAVAYARESGFTLVPSSGGTLVSI